MNPIRISISISDPWELGEAVNWQPLKGELLEIVNDERGGRALVKVDEAIDYHGSSWRYLVVMPRDEGKEMAGLLKDCKLSGSCTAISDRNAQFDNPLDTGSWRGGLAFIGDLELSS